MSKKQEFINYIQNLMNIADAPEMNEEARLYWEAFQQIEENEKPMFTDNGKMILKFLQDNPQGTMWKAKAIAEELIVNSRTVSGAMRKLVTDGYVEKIGKDPTIYTITEKGKNIKIEE